MFMLNQGPNILFGQLNVDYKYRVLKHSFSFPHSLQADRPARAYSVGSRLEHNKRKLLEHRQPTTADNHNTKSSRLRAFSVGAKVPRSDSYRGVIQKAPLSTVFMKKDANAVNNNQKSASVSTLHTYREQHQAAQIQQQQLASSPHQFLHQQLQQQQHAVSSLPSNDPMDDLMEIDFTTSSSATSSGVGAAHHTSSTNAMDEDVCGDLPTTIDAPLGGGPALVKSLPMSVPVARKLGDDHHPQLQTGSRGIDPPNGYVPMRPSLKTSSMGSNISGSIGGNSSLRGDDVVQPAPTMPPMMMLNSTGSSYNSNSYMCMKPVGASAAATPQLSPSTSSFPYHHSPKTTSIASTVLPQTTAIGSSSLGRSNNNSHSDYLPMSPQQNHATISAMTAAAATAAAATTPTPSTPAPSSAPEGYMEMKWIKPTPGEQQQQSSGVAISNNNDSSNSAAAASPRLASMPININHPPRKSALELHNEQRKHIGTMSLAVKSRVRCDSKDSGIMTPTGSSAHSNSIFPFSPSSPKAHHQTAFAVSVPSPTAATNRKCLIDATNGTLHLAAASLDEAAEEMRASAAALTAGQHRVLVEQPKVQNKDQTPMQVDTLSSDYADMTLEPKSAAATITTTGAAAVAGYLLLNLYFIFILYCTKKRKHWIHILSMFLLSVSIFVFICSNINLFRYRRSNPATVTTAPLTAQLQRTKPCNLQRPSLSSARETTNADYTLMKPSYPYPKKKPLLVQINNNLTNATSKTNATAFRSIATAGGSSSGSSGGGSGSTTPSTPPLSATSSAAAAGSGPYEMLLARSNSVAQEKITSTAGVVKQLNTMPLMRSTSANSERMQLSPVIVLQPTASSGCSSQSNSPIVTASSSATTSSSSSTSTLCGEQVSAGKTTHHGRPAANLAAVMVAVQRASSNDSAASDDSNEAAAVGASRPPSVSSERELYYASLDLPNSTSSGSTATSGTATATASMHSTPGTPTSADDDSNGPRTAAAQSSAVSCSPAAQQPATAAGIFSYAQIDFVKCEPQIKSPAMQTQTSVTSVTSVTADSSAADSTTSGGAPST